MAISGYYSASRRQDYYPPEQTNHQSRALSFPHRQVLPPVNFVGDPIGASQHLKETLFPNTRQAKCCSMQVYIFTMPNHFLILLSPGRLPFTSFTHIGDGLYQVNPLYCRPCFTYPISKQFYDVLCNQHVGLDGVPSFVTFKGSWNNIEFHPKLCYGSIPQLITKPTEIMRTRFFSMSLIKNTWKPSDTLRGVAYSLDGKAFRLWLHEKKPKALNGAIKEKSDQIRQLKKLERFLTNISRFNADWRSDLFKSQDEINKIGDWRQRAIILVDGHPDKSRPEDESLSKSVQKLIKDFRDKSKEIKRLKKKPIEKQIKVNELEVIRQNLVQKMREFLDETLQWIASSSLSFTPKFLRGIQSTIRAADRELRNLQASIGLLSQPDKEVELERLGCPTSAYKSTMQIKSTTEKATPRQQAWVYLPTCIELIDWYLQPLSNASHRDAPPVPVRFFEEAMAFLQKKRDWARKHGVISQLEPHRFLNLVRYHTRTLSELHSRFNELRRLFTSAPVPQKAVDSYPYLFEEISYLDQFVNVLKVAFNAVSPDYGFEFYQETEKLHAKRKAILAGGSIYKRVNSGGNAEAEFLPMGTPSSLNNQNRVHTRIYP